MSAALSSTRRTTLTRHDERGTADRADLFAVLEEALVCHVGIVRDGEPVVLPSTFGVDPEGPDEGGTLYLHGSVAAPWLLQAPGQTVCATFTLLDGAVLARAAFSHSMNYRSAVVYGHARRVEDPAERDLALRLVVDHLVPGRSATLREHTRTSQRPPTSPTGWSSATASRACDPRRTDGRSSPLCWPEVRGRTTRRPAVRRPPGRVRRPGRPPGGSGW